jgi:hypothetical protein
MKRLYFCVAAIFVTAGSLFGQTRPTAFINARVIPVTGSPIEQGILLVQDGKIKAVGDARTVRLSSDVLLAAGVDAHPAVTIEHTWSGDGLGRSWKSPDKRSAFAGTFTVP